MSRQVSPARARGVVLSVVRGDSHWSALHRLGVEVRFATDRCVIEEPAGTPVVRPSVADVAAGLLRHASRGQDPREWACVVLGCTFIDFSAVEAHERGDWLLEALWQAAEGVGLSRSDLPTLESLAA
jgi:hypothetical protein